MEEKRRDLFYVTEKLKKIIENQKINTEHRVKALEVYASLLSNKWSN